MERSGRHTDEMARLLDIFFDLILAVVAARYIASTFRRLFGTATGQPPPREFSSQTRQEKQTIHGEMVRDPVCGMFVSTELSHRLEWHGTLLHFCSEECLEQYQKRAAS